MLDKSPMFDSNSRKRFHTSTDSCGVRPPDDSTRSNSTRVLLSSGEVNTTPDIIRSDQIQGHSTFGLTIQMWQIVHIAFHILGIAAELLQAQFKYTKCDVFVLAAIVFHECSSHEYMIPRTDVFTCLFEYRTRWLNAFSTTCEFHVLHICLQKLRGIETVYTTELQSLESHELTSVGSTSGIDMNLLYIWWTLSYFMRPSSKSAYAKYKSAFRHNGPLIARSNMLAASSANALADVKSLKIVQWHSED